MPNDLTAQTTTAKTVASVSAAASPTRSDGVAPASTAKLSEGHSVAPHRAGHSAAPVSLHSNPVSFFDPSVGLVVLQFYNAQGVEKESIPSHKQIESYRLHAAQQGPQLPGQSNDSKVSSIDNFGSRSGPLE